MVTYVFSDANRKTSYISETELNLRGTWAAGTTYVPPIDTVNYSGALWIAVLATTNVSPTTVTRTRQWSQLVTYKEGPPPTDASRAQATADAAYTLATTGTAAAADALAVAESASDVADAAYVIAVAGTNLAASALALASTAQSTATSAQASAAAAQSLATSSQSLSITALQTAWSGTAGVLQDQAIAVSGTAGVNQVYPIAVAGTNLANLALTWLGTLTVGASTDQVARNAAWSGTAGVEQLLGMFAQGTSAGTIFTNQAVASEAALRAAADTTLQAQSYLAIVTAWSGTAGAEQAFALAVSGTDQTASALAVAQTALTTAWSGTAGVEQVYPIATAGTTLAASAYALAQTAYNLIASGTDATAALLRADEAYNLATSGTAGVGQVFPIAVAGTDLGFSALQTAWSGTASAASALATANTALSTAWSGTSGADTAFALATSGTAGANQAFAIAVSGTTTANAALARTGGTLTGNLRVPQVFYSYGTVATSSAVSGTIYYDMTGPAYQFTTVDMNLWVSAKNLTQVAEVCAVLVSDGVQRTIGYDGNFSWFGTQIPYTPITSDKKVLVPLASTGTNLNTVIGATSPQL